MLTRWQPGHVGRRLPLKLLDDQSWHMPIFHSAIATGVYAQGLGHTIGYAGDGINDVEALRTADVGISIGTGAVIAASIYTPAHSLYGMLAFTPALRYNVCAPWLQPDITEHASCCLALHTHMYSLIYMFNSSGLFVIHMTGPKS